MKSNNRVIQLDILRAFAILLVMFHHIPAKFVGHSLLSQVFWAFKKGGWMGVDMFFVLSGFLVSGIYFREYLKTGKVSVGNFLIRRGLKIYPNFFFFLIITAIVGYLLGEYYSLNTLFSEIFFYQSYLPLPQMWGPTWSIAVEEHFYLLLSLIFYVLSKIYTGKKSDKVFNLLPVIFLGVAIMCMSFRLYNNIIHPQYDFLTHYGNSHIRIDSLMFGVLLAYLYYFKKEKLQIFNKYKFQLLTISILMLGVYFIVERPFHNWISVIGLTHLYLCFGTILLTFLNINIKENFITKGFKIIGKNSYAIYLWHAPVLHWLILLSGSFYVVFAYFIVSIALGSVLTYTIEIPMLKLRDRIFPSKSGILKVQ